MTRRTAYAVLSPLDLILLFAFLGTMLAFGALAADAVVVPAAASGVTLDLTGIAVSVIAGIFAVLGVVLPLLIANRDKNVQSAATLAAAVKNSLGAMEQATTAGVEALKPVVTIPGVPAALTVPVQYVLDHAGAEATNAMKTTGFTDLPAYLASKVSAQIGLAKIAAAPTTTVPSAVITTPAIAMTLGALAHA
jgi:hypothetical protein